MKKIFLIPLIMVSILILINRLSVFLISQHRLSSQNKINTKADSSTEEVNIKSERYMFSPMLVRLKRGRAIKLVLSSYDVQHGLFQPDLRINLSAYPGKTAETIIIPEKIGEYTVDCSLYCGVDHNKMKMTFIVDE